MDLSIAKLEHAIVRRITHPLHVEIGRALIAVVLIIAIAFTGFAIHLNLAAAILVLLLTTVVLSIQWGVLQGTAASLAAVGCLDFLFTPPVFRFTVNSRENWVALVTFEVTALMVSRLSWKERLHAQDQEYQRQAITKLYHLSNAILLVDSRSSDLEQLAALTREFFSVDSVGFWVAEDNRRPFSIAEPDGMSGAAYQVFLTGNDEDSIEGRWSHRLLRMGTTPIGAMILQGWEVDAPLADAVGSLIAVAVERARSAQKENRAEAARNTELLRTAVLDALAHSFKTPLTAIQTASSGLLAIGRLGHTQAELVEIIDQEVAMLASLTSRLLQTAALDAKEIRVRSATVSLMQLVEGIVREQEPEIRGRIHIIDPLRLADVQADAQLLSLAFTQLIDNASKYSRVGSEIELCFRQEQTRTVISFSNEGESIPTEALSRIFERYYRGPHAGRGPVGTGLGLSIVKKIAEAHGGDATATCEHNRITISVSIMGGVGSVHG